MNLTRLPLLALLVLSLFGGAFAVTPTPVSADEKHDKKCHEHCDDDVDASVVIDGGDVSVSTAIDISADGGVAAADASGGDHNVAAAADGSDVAAAGNGGVAVAEANGGTVTVGNITTGGNSGNTIVVGNVGGGDDDCKKDCEPKCEKDCEPKCHKDCEPKCEKDCEPKPEPPKKCDKCDVTVVVKKATTAKGGGTVAKLPSTGTGAVQGDGGANGALTLLAALGALGAAGYGLRRRIA